MPPDARTWPLARPDLDAFELSGTRDAHCLLLHGFTASPVEVRPLGEALAAAGFPVRAPRLPGHGTHVEELAAVTPGRWLAAAEEALASLPGKVLLAGQSMGGLLSLLLAARNPERVRAVATLGAPLAFADRRARLIVPILRWTPFAARLVRWLPKGPSQIPEEKRAVHFTYDRFPVSGLFLLSDLMRDASRALPRVKAPLLAVHGVLDRTAPPFSARRIVTFAGSATKEHVEMRRSRHVLTMDVESEAVCGHVVEFFSRHAA